MVYLVKKIVKGKPYFYLTANLKIGGKSKKIQLYAGSRRPSAKRLKQFTKLLKKRVWQYREAADPFFTLVSDGDKRVLERIRLAYKRLLKQTPTVREKYYEWFITTFTYNSNAIEGSTLTPRETAMVLYEELTPPSKPMRDVRATENHKKVFEWMMSYKRDVNKQFIFALHKKLTTGILPASESGKLRKVQVWVRGSEELPPSPVDAEVQLTALLKWYNANKNRYHPVIVAAYFHTAFEGIHPFVDFNGRTGRLLLNFILMRKGFPPIDIRNAERQAYYNAIRAALSGDLRHFANLVVKYLKEMFEKLGY